jgi:hypothetical protein
MYTRNLIQTAADVIWFFLHFSSFSNLVYHILVNKAISFFRFVLSSRPFIYFIVSSLGLLGGTFKCYFDSISWSLILRTLNWQVEPNKLCIIILVVVIVIDEIVDFL